MKLLQHTLALGCIQHRGATGLSWLQAEAKACSNMQLSGLESFLAPLILTAADTSSRAACQAHCEFEGHPLQACSLTLR